MVFFKKIFLLLFNMIFMKQYSFDGVINQCLNFQEGLVKIDNLTPQELIGTMDASLATLVSLTPVIQKKVN